MNVSIPFVDPPDSVEADNRVDGLEALSAFLNVLGMLGVGSDVLASGTGRLPGLGSEGAGCTAIVVGEFVALVLNGAAAAGNGEMPTDTANC